MCGRLIRIDEVWWQESGWESALGVTAYLVEDERKGGQCAPCRRLWKDSKENLERSRPTPYDEHSRPKALAAAELRRKVDRARAKWFSTIWGEEVEAVYE